MTNTTLTETQQTYAGELLNPENTVYFKFHAGKSMTDYVTIEIASIEPATEWNNKPARAVCHNMTYHLAKNFGLGLGRRNTAREFQIPQGGGGYSKTHNVAYTMMHNLGLNEIPQTWNY